MVWALLIVWIVIVVSMMLAGQRLYRLQFEPKLLPKAAVAVTAALFLASVLGAPAFGWQGRAAIAGLSVLMAVGLAASDFWIPSRATARA